MSRPQRPTRSPHGTNARYVAGCSCFECCEAHAAYQRERGCRTVKTNVPLEVVRAHIDHLKREHRMSRRAIADMSGVSYKTLRNIDDGVFESVTAATAEALLALRGPVASDTTALISAAPTHRLIARLQARGISRRRLALEVGIAVKSLPQKGQRRVQARTAQRIREAAERLGVRPPQDGHARATLAIDAIAVDTMISAHGYEIAAVLEAAELSSETWTQIRAGRKVTETTAERLARALGARPIAIVREEAAA